MTEQFYPRGAIAAALVLALLVCMPTASQGQTFTNSNDPNLNAYFILHLGRNGPMHDGPNAVGYPSRWPLSGDTIDLELPLIDVCSNGMGMSDCSGAVSNDDDVRITEGRLLGAMRDSAFEWNREIRKETIADQEFFTGCDGTDCDNMETYTPVVPTAALILANGDNAGNATGFNSTTGGSNPGNRSCVFPAWSVNPDGSFKEFVSITQDEDTGVLTYTEVGDQLADADNATWLCTHFVPHTEADLLMSDSIPDTFQPQRDSLDRIIVGTGDGRNRIQFEQVDFLTAGGGDVDPDATLAVTVTRGYIGGGPVGSIAEADILFNADLVLTDSGENAVVRWTTSGATAASPAYECLVLHDAINPEEAVDPMTSSPDVDDGGTQLCYRGTSTEFTGTMSVPDKVGMVPYTKFDVANVMTHEMGHFVGLDHPCREFELVLAPGDDELDCRNDAESFGLNAPQSRYSVTTMFWNAREGQTKSRTIEQPDIDGLVALFALNVNAIFATTDSGFCTINPRSNGWGWATWLIVLMPAVLLLQRKRAPARAGSKSRRNLLAALLALGVLAGASAAQATTVVARSTSEMVSRADHLAHVKVVDVRVVRRPDGWISTVYTLTPVESIKGEGSFEISVPGGQIGNEVVNVAGAPTLQLGREYVIFAKRASNGRNIVSGVFEGVKPIAKDAETGTTYVRTGAAVPGSLQGGDGHGAHAKDAAVGAQELPALMQLEDYKAYLRSLAGK